MKILIIEDDEHALGIYLEALRGCGDVIVAKTHKQAHRAIRENPDVRLVVLDGIVPFWDDGSSLRRTDELFHYIEHYLDTAEVIAASSDSEITRELVKAGCRHSINQKDPYALREIVRSILTSTP